MQMAVVRFTLLLAPVFAFLPLRAGAALYADVESSLGTFTIDLDYANAPIAVGNFIGLALGELPWVDPDTGRVQLGVPYFDGQVFHRVVTGFVNQTGSATGLGTGGPGYRFADELATSDFSEPYRVAMANSGPQSNGSQFFITAPATSLPTHLNGFHTVIGFVPADDGPGGVVDGSRAVMDAINAVPKTGEVPTTPVVILGVTIRRTDPAAEAFQIPVADLPAVTTALSVGGSRVNGGFELLFDQPPGSTLILGVSEDLADWRVESRYLSSDQPFSAPLVPSQPDGGTAKQFFLPTLVTPPIEVTFPNGAAGRVLTANAASFGTITCTFTTDGPSGSYEFVGPGGAPFITGSILDGIYLADDYGGRIVLLLSGINPRVWAFNRLGIDSWDSSAISGRHNLRLFSTVDDFNNPLIPGTQASGNFTLSR